MLYQIASFLLDVVGGLLTGACLLRLYMQWQRIPFANPVGGLVFALSDWIVLPLRKLIPPIGRLDVSSLVAAVLFQLVQYFLLALLLSALGGGSSFWTWLPVLALIGLARVAVSGLIGLLIVHVVMSWVQAHTSLSDAIARLCGPVLRPFRRVIPLLGGFDLSPLVLMVLLQVVMMVLGHLQASLVR
ncbi:MAG: YggT family protein [Acidovorax sp.]|nr:MAG: YggT family protein [Acidovorax sp.]